MILLLFAFICAVVAEYPTGHLMPFGHHRPPTVPVAEFTRENAPQPDEFYNKYVKHSKPVIFRNALVDSKAFQLWDDEYVRTNFGEMEVRLEGKKEKKHLPPIGEKYLGRDNLRHFVDTYHQSGNNVYIVSDLPSRMYQDMGVAPSFGACGEMSRNIVEVDVWWSGGGSSSIIHKDAYNQMNCLLNGTKYWKLIEYKYEKDIYKHPEPENEVGGFSDVNPEKVDLLKQPTVKNVEWSNITINAGDCLFLPKSYYHQVNSMGTNNKAVSLLFSRFDNRENLDFSDCTKDTDYSTVRPLSEFSVHWPWRGKGVMVMGNSDLEEGARLMLLSGVYQAKQRNRNFDDELYKRFLEEMHADSPMPVELRNNFDPEVLREADRDGKGYIDENDVLSMSIDLLRRFGDQIERYEPSNTYEFEYSVIPFETVWTLLKLCSKQFKTLERDRWIKLYKKIGGSDAFGEELFSELAGGKPQVTFSGITDDMLYDALKKWVKYWAPQYSELKEPPTDLTSKNVWYKAGLRWIYGEAPELIKFTPKTKSADGEEAQKDEL